MKRNIKDTVLHVSLYLGLRGEGGYSGELFQLQMGFSFPFLRAKDLRTSLLIMRTCSFFTLLYVGGTYARGQGGGRALQIT